MIYTADKDGQYITEVRINSGEDVAYRCTQFDPDEGWAELFEVDNEGNWVFAANRFNIARKRVYGEITFTDKRDDAR